MTNPTPTDWRALCAELLQELCCHYRSWELKEGYCSDAMTRARAALAQPEPQGPTDEELDEFAVFWWGSDTDERTVTDVIECCSMTAYARAVLARWGTCGFGRNVRVYMEPIDG